MGHRALPLRGGIESGEGVSHEFSGALTELAGFGPEGGGEVAVDVEAA